MMILLRGKLFRLFHFAKPTLSNIASLTDLESVLQKRLVRNIAEVNEKRLRHHSLHNSLQDQLILSEESAKEIEERTVKHSVFNVSNGECQVVEARIGEDLSKLVVEGLEYPFTSADQRLKHFSEKRGAANFQELQEYELDDHTLLIFNLPENINEQDIQATLRTNNIQTTFKYCILGLPAFAKVKFATAEELRVCLEKIPSRRIAFGQRVAVIKGVQDAERLRLGWRRLVVELEPESQFSDFAVELSKYGRVIHIDWPQEGFLNPSLEDVKNYYEKSNDLIKINQYHRDGTVESEYFPRLSAWDQREDDIGVENVIERAERLKESYEHRARFARNIDVHIGKENTPTLRHRGYCVVTFSTYQQSQNFYFSQSNSIKMSLVGERLDFQFDSLFKRQLLRQIDNEYLKGKKIQAQQKAKHQKQYIDPVKQGFSGLEYQEPNYDRITATFQQRDQYDIYSQILNKLCYTQLTQTKNSTNFLVKRYKDDNTFQDWRQYLRDFKSMKEKTNRKTFDQLAEIELFGRVLPKDSNIERFIVEDTRVNRKRENDLVQDNYLLTSQREIKAKQKFYKRIQDRNNRMANERFGIPTEDVEEEVDRQEEAIDASVEDGENIGKHSFSTRKPVLIYRKRNAEEQAHFQHRYNQFVRSSIYEYMGVFHDKEIEEAASFKHSIVNPQSLKWPDGSSYFQEEDIIDVLQFRRDFAQAQIDYEDHVYGSEYIKSSGANLGHINANFKQFEGKAIEYLTDYGVVEEVRKVGGDKIQEKVNVLNATVAGFGEQYKAGQQNGESLLVKVRKLENLLPLNRVNHLEEFIAQNSDEITPQQSAVFEKHYHQMRETGVIPPQVCAAFNVQQGTTLNDILATVGSAHNINKKDLQMAERAKSYSKQELKQDIDHQLKVEQSRKRNRKIGSHNYAKDPSEIYAKDREGYYKVSRYRQI